MKKIYSILFIWMVALSSCIDDKGNYEYLEVDDINITGPSYTQYVNMKDPLVLKGQFKYVSEKPINQDDFTYEWKIRENVVGTDSILEIPSVELPFGSYKAMFSVISKATGIRYVKTFTIQVDTKYANGWLVLYKDGAKADLAYLKGKQEYNYDTYEYEWKYSEEERVYSEMNDEFLPESSKKIVDHGYKPGKGAVKPGGVMIVYGGPDGGIELNGASMQKEYTVRELFLEGVLPAGFELKDVVYAGTGIYALGENGSLYSGRYVDKVFYTSRLSHLRTQFEGKDLLIDHFIPTEFRQSSFVWLMYSKAQKAFISVFDDDSNVDDPAYEEVGGVNNPEFWLSGTFMKNVYNGGELPERCEDFVMLDNVNMRVVASGYMNSGWGVHQAGYLFILQDETTGKVYLQRHEDVLDRYIPASVVTPRYHLATNLPIDKDDIFLINAIGDQDVFFSHDGVIYAFEPDYSDEVGFRVLVMDDTYRGKKITSMEFNNDAKRLCVGFEDGTVIIYKKPNIGEMGEPDYKPVEWFHKQYPGPVIDVVFKNGAEVQGNTYTNEPTN